MWGSAKCPPNAGLSQKSVQKKICAAWITHTWVVLYPRSDTKSITLSPPTISPSGIIINICDVRTVLLLPITSNMSSACVCMSLPRGTWDVCVTVNGWMTNTNSFWFSVLRPIIMIPIGLWTLTLPVTFRLIYTVAVQEAELTLAAVPW